MKVNCCYKVKVGNGLVKRQILLYIMEWFRFDFKKVRINVHKQRIAIYTMCSKVSGHPAKCVIIVEGDKVLSSTSRNT